MLAASDIAKLVATVGKMRL